MKPASVSRSAWLAFAFVLALSAWSFGCKRPPPPPGDDSVANASPPVVKDSSLGLLFTWIDEKGQFHIQEKPADIPLVGRDAVRVVDPANYDANHPDRIS